MTPRVKNRQRERAAAVAVLRWARLVLPVGSLVAAIRNEEQPRTDDPRSRARFHAARKAAGVLVGMPDMVALLPAGRAVFIEMKAEEGGVLSLAQQGVHQRLRSLGHQVIVATSIETARGGLRAAGVPLREDPAQLAVITSVRKAKPKLSQLDMPLALP